MDLNNIKTFVQPGYYDTAIGGNNGCAEVFIFAVSKDAGESRVKSILLGKHQDKLRLFSMKALI